MRSLFLLLVLLPQLAFAQYKTQAVVTPIEAVVQEADAATVYELDKTVAVVLVNPKAKKSLASTIEVTSEAKFVTVSAGTEFTNIQPLKKLSDTEYLLIGDAGKYLVMILESSPDGPASIQFLEIVLGEKPIDPIPDPPPGNYESLSKVVSEGVAKLNDPKTAMALSKAYQSAIADPNLAIGGAGVYREAALLANGGVTVDWNGLFKLIDAEFVKLQIKTVEEYKAALGVLVKGYTPSQAQVKTLKMRYVQVCQNGVCRLVPQYYY